MRPHAVVCFPAGARDADRVMWAVAETVALGKLIKMSEVHLQLTNTIATDFSAHCSRLRHSVSEQAAGRYSGIPTCRPGTLHRSVPPAYHIRHLRYVCRIVGKMF